MDRPNRWDVGAALVVLALAEQEVWVPLGPGFSHRVGPAPALALVGVLTSIPLLFRRRWPLGVVTVISAVLATYFLIYGAPDGLAMVLPGVFAMYAVGRHGTTRDLLLAACLTIAANVIHMLRDPQPPLPVGPTLVVWTFMLASGALGWMLRRRAQDVSALEDRAALLEVERDLRTKEAAAAERSRISRELHDLVGHGLALVVLQAMRAQASLEQSQSDAVREQLARLEGTARSTLAEMRRLLNVLGESEAPLGPQPGIADIEDLVSSVQAQGLPVTLEVDSAAMEVPGGIGLAAYRVVQEGLTNVLKHASGPRDVRVKLAISDGLLSIRIDNDGQHTNGTFREGRGLAGIRERVALFGGTFEVRPHSGDGFTLHAQLPSGAEK